MSGFATTSRVHASLRPRALAYVLRVPIVGLAILPVSSLLIVARSIPVRSAISVRLNPCRSRSRRKPAKASNNSGSPHWRVFLSIGFDVFSQFVLILGRLALGPTCLNGCSLLVGQAWRHRVGVARQHPLDIWLRMNYSSIS